MLNTSRQPADLICIHCAGQSFRDARDEVRKKILTNCSLRKTVCGHVCIHVCVCVCICVNRLIDNIPG